MSGRETKAEEPTASAVAGSFVWPPYYAHAGIPGAELVEQLDEDDWLFHFGLAVGARTPINVAVDATLQKWLGYTEMEITQVFELAALLYSIGYEAGPVDIAAIILNLHLEVVDSHSNTDTQQLEVGALREPTVEYLNLTLLCMTRLSSRIYVSQDGTITTHADRVTPTTVRLYIKTAGAATLLEMIGGGIGIILRTPEYQEAARRMASELIRGIRQHCARVGEDEVTALVGMGFTKMWQMTLVGVDDGRRFDNFLGSGMVDLDDGGRKYVHGAVARRQLALVGEFPITSVKVITGSYMLGVQAYALKNFVNGLEIQMEARETTLLAKVFYAGAVSQLSRHGGHVLFLGSAMPFRYPLSESLLRKQEYMVGSQVTQITLVGNYEEKLRMFNFLSAVFAENMALLFGGLVQFNVLYRRTTLDIMSVYGRTDGSFDRRLLNPLMASSSAVALLRQPITVVVATEALNRRVERIRSRVLRRDPLESEGYEFGRMLHDLEAIWAEKSRGRMRYV